MDEKQMREMFEDIARQIGMTEVQLGKDAQGRYNSLRAAEGFRIFRFALQSPEVKKLVEAATSMLNAHEGPYPHDLEINLRAALTPFTQATESKGAGDE